VREIHEFLLQALAAGEMDPGRALDILLAPPSIQEELIRFEERLIKHVLAQRNGSVSDSPSAFPLIQEPLTCIIELRPKPSQEANYESP
jgi:hypothetical protein